MATALVTVATMLAAFALTGERRRTASAAWVAGALGLGFALWSVLAT